MTQPDHSTVSKAAFTSAWIEFCRTNGSQEYWRRFGDYLFTDPTREIPRELLSLPAPSFRPSAAIAPCAHRRVADANRGSGEARLLDQDPQRSRGSAGDRNTSSSATAPSARARCSPTPISMHSLRLKPERIRRVRLPHRALAVLALRLLGQRSSLSRLDEMHNRREAEKIEAAEREKAKQLSRNSRRQIVAAARRCGGPLLARSGSITPAPTIPSIGSALLIEFFGKDKLLTDITDEDVTRAGRVAAWASRPQAPAR